MKKYYLDLGYIEQEGSFYVKSDDLSDTSGIMETRICDECSKFFTRRHEHHVTTFKRFGKDLCGECVATNKQIREEIQKKKEATWEDKYGMHPMKVGEIKEKVQEVYQEKYGGHPMHNEHVKAEWFKRVNEKYGGNSPQCSDKVRTKTLQTLSKYGEVPTSKQQKELYDILCEIYSNNNCTLNYLFSNMFFDILLEYKGIKIDIEYDGKHWHQTPEKDRRRDEYSKSNGFKVLRIKSAHKLPSKEQIVNTIEELVTSDKKYSEMVLADW